MKAAVRRERVVVVVRHDHRPRIRREAVEIRRDPGERRAVRARETRRQALREEDDDVREARRARPPGERRIALVDPVLQERIAARGRDHETESSCRRGVDRREDGAFPRLTPDDHLDQGDEGRSVRDVVRLVQAVAKPPRVSGKRSGSERASRGEEKSGERERPRRAPAGDAPRRLGHERHDERRCHDHDGGGDPPPAENERHMVHVFDRQPREVLARQVVRQELERAREELGKEQAVREQPEQEPAVDEERARGDDDQHVDEVAREEREDRESGGQRIGSGRERELRPEPREEDRVPDEDEAGEKEGPPRSGDPGGSARARGGPRVSQTLDDILRRRPPGRPLTVESSKGGPKS